MDNIEARVKKIVAEQLGVAEEPEFLKRAQHYPAPNADLDKKMQDLWTEMIQSK